MVPPSWLWWVLPSTCGSGAQLSEAQLALLDQARRAGLTTVVVARGEAPDEAPNDTPSSTSAAGRHDFGC